MATRAGTIAKNIIKWGLVCAAVGLAIAVGVAAIGAYTSFGGAFFVAATHASIAGAHAFFAGATWISAAIGAAVGGVFGVGAGILQAQRECDSPACETSMATRAEKMLGKEPSISHAVGNGYVTGKAQNFDNLYQSAAIQPATNHVENLNRSAARAASSPVR